MKKVKAIATCIIVVAIILGIGVVSASANPSSWCLTHKDIGCTHCVGHSIMGVGSATANCVNPGGGIGYCITSGCSGHTFYSIAPLDHSYTNMVCTRSVSCGWLNTSNSSHFQHYMYRVGNHARKVSNTYKAGHYSIDITATSGSATYRFPIYAQGSGTVIQRGTDEDDDRGFFITIQYTNGYRVRYLHMDEHPFSGTTVSHTTQLGLTGYTGKTDPSNINGTHLHYDVNDTVIPTQSNSSNINPVNLFPSGTFN